MKTITLLFKTYSISKASTAFRPSTLNPYRDTCTPLLYHTLPQQRKLNITRLSHYATRLAAFKLDARRQGFTRKSAF
jgi:hypothetical protein